MKRDYIRGKIDAEETRQRMPSNSVPLRDCVPSRFGERMRRFVQTQSLQQFLFKKTLAMKSQEGSTRMFHSEPGKFFLGCERSNEDVLSNE
jgi:hypothetical protein